MGIPYNRIEGYGTSDRLIIRNQGVDPRSKAPGDTRDGRDRIIVLNRDTEKETARSEGMLVFVEPGTARKAFKLITDTKQDSKIQPWEFRILQEKPQGAKHYRSIRCSADVENFCRLFLFLVRKDEAGQVNREKIKVGEAFCAPQMGMPAVIVRAKGEYRRDGKFREVIITKPLTETQSTAVLRVARAAAV